MGDIAWRSQEALDRLIAGEALSHAGISVSLQKGTLGPATVAELAALYREDARETSNEAARIFLARVKAREEKVATEAGEVEQVEENEAAGEGGETQAAVDEASVSAWRITDIEAYNFRGLTLPKGNFTLSLQGKPQFVFGTNGSGKTNIVSAIVWCLTGHSVREREQPTDEVRGVGIYSDEGCTDCVCTDWPEIVTVPMTLTEARSASEARNCWVRVGLVSGEREVWVTRSFAGKGLGVLQITEDGTEAGGLGAIGLDDFQLELSLLMPSRVSAVQFSHDSAFSTNLLKVAGLNDLIEIGAFSALMRTAVKRVQTDYGKQGDALGKEAQSTVKTATDAGEFGEDITALLNGAAATPGAIEGEGPWRRKWREYDSQRASVEERHGEEELALVSAIWPEAGAGGEEDRVPDKERLAEVSRRLVGAEAVLSRGAVGEWPLLAEWTSMVDDLGAVQADIEETISSIEAELANMERSWSESRDDLGRLNVRIEAARYIASGGDSSKCPVCDQVLPDAVKQELDALKERVAADDSRVRQFAAASARTLEEKLPQAVRGLKDTDPAVQVEELFRAQLLYHMRDLGTLEEAAKSECLRAREKLEEWGWTAEEETPSELEGEQIFRDLIASWQQSVCTVRRRLSLATWVQGNVRVLTDEASGVVEGLIPRVQELAKYAGRMSRLGVLTGALKAAAGKCLEADGLDAQAKYAGELYVVLDPVRDVEKYARASLNDELVNIASDMQRYYGALYPNDAVGLAGFAERKEGTRGISYHAALDWVDGQLFVELDNVVNAGRTRGVLWSYVFALCDRNQPALGALVLDDPFVSLDDYAADAMIGIVRGLAQRFQTLATVHQEHHLHRIRAVDPDASQVALLHVLPRDKRHRDCRVIESVEPLKEALGEFETDNAEFKGVVREARLYLERNLKLVARYVLEGDHDGEAIGALSTAFGDALQDRAKLTPAGQRASLSLQAMMKGLGFNMALRPPAIPNSNVVMHSLHHGGPTESFAAPYHAQQVKASYEGWVSTFREFFEEIGRILSRLQDPELKRAVGLPALDPDLLPVISARFDQPIREIGAVAAEGTVAIQDDGEIGEDCEWDELLFAEVASEVASPVLLPGQIAVVSPDEVVANGDLGLIGSGDRFLLRRLFATEDEEGMKWWIGVAPNPTLYDCEPVRAADADVITRKIVGVLYSSGMTNPAAAVGEVTRPARWSDVMGRLNGGKLMMIRVHGHSAEPVALDGQFVLAEKVEDVTGLTDRDLCCVRLDNGRAVLKRFYWSQAEEGRTILQSLNPLPSQSIIEAIVPGAARAPGFGVLGLPAIDEVWMVRGVLFNDRFLRRSDEAAC